MGRLPPALGPVGLPPGLTFSLRLGTLGLGGCEGTKMVAVKGSGETPVFLTFYLPLRVLECPLTSLTLEFSTLPPGLASRN